MWLFYNLPDHWKIWIEDLIQCKFSAHAGVLASLFPQTLATFFGAPACFITTQQKYGLLSTVGEQMAATGVRRRRWWTRHLRIAAAGAGWDKSIGMTTSGTCLCCVAFVQRNGTVLLSQAAIVARTNKHRPISSPI